MSPHENGPPGLVPQALRALEHRLGAHRDDRSLWVWTVPATTVVVTFAVLVYLGVQGRVDLFLTISMALVLSVFLGSLSAFYLTAASADDADSDDGPGGSGPADGPDPAPPAGMRSPMVLRVPAAPREEEPTPAVSPRD